MGWEVRVAPDVTETPAPSAEELRLIREELDPGGIYTG
jgi:glutaconate CoA-transferase subunit B